MTLKRQISSSVNINLSCPKKCFGWLVDDTGQALSLKPTPLRRTPWTRVGAEARGLRDATPQLCPHLLAGWGAGGLGDSLSPRDAFSPLLTSGGCSSSHDQEAKSKGSVTRTPAPNLQELLPWDPGAAPGKEHNPGNFHREASPVFPTHSPWGSPIDPTLGPLPPWVEAAAHQGRGAVGPSLLPAPTELQGGRQGQTPLPR